MKFSLNMEELKLLQCDIPFVFVSAVVPPVDLLGAAFVNKAEMGRDIIPDVVKAFSGPSPHFSPGF